MAVIVVSCSLFSATTVYWRLPQNLYVAATAVKGVSYRLCHGIYPSLLPTLCYQTCRRWCL